MVALAYRWRGNHQDTRGLVGAPLRHYGHTIMARQRSSYAISYLSAAPLLTGSRPHPACGASPRIPGIVQVHPPRCTFLRQKERAGTPHQPCELRGH